MILVTGGGGFIGAALVRALLAAGKSVRVFGNDYRDLGGFNRLTDLEVERVFADIRNENAVMKACHGVDEVIHLAGINGTKTFYSDPGLVLDVGVRGALNVLSGCRAHGVKKVLLASSSEVCRAEAGSAEGVPLVIPDPYNARYSYSAAKIISEMLLIHGGIEDLRIIRPFNVYGPGMASGHVVPDFIAQMRQQNEAYPKGVVPFQILGSGEETRSFSFIDDVVCGIMLVRNGAPGIYNVGNDEETTIADLARLIGKLFGRALELDQRMGLREGEIQRRRPDISKLKALGYVPSVPLSEGLRRTAII